MSAVARLGDPGSHPGAISSASSDVMANGISVARQGDGFACDIHGPQTLVAITTKTFANNKLVITVGAQTTCGATIISGSPTVNAE